MVVVEPGEEEPTVQKIGKTINGMEGNREMTIIYRREHFNSSGGETLIPVLVRLMQCSAHAAIRQTIVLIRRSIFPCVVSHDL